MRAPSAPAGRGGRPHRRAPGREGGRVTPAGGGGGSHVRVCDRGVGRGGRGGACRKGGAFLRALPTPHTQTGPKCSLAGIVLKGCLASQWLWGLVLTACTIRPVRMVCWSWGSLLARGSLPPPLPSSASNKCNTPPQKKQKTQAVLHRPRRRQHSPHSISSCSIIRHHYGLPNSVARRSLSVTCVGTHKAESLDGNPSPFDVAWLEWVEVLGHSSPTDALHTPQKRPLSGHHAVVARRTRGGGGWGASGLCAAWLKGLASTPRGWGMTVSELDTNSSRHGIHLNVVGF